MTDPGEAPPLRLGVLDEEDLAVISAHLQDAEATLQDMAYLLRERRFALVVSRFDWPLALTGRFERCRTGLHFERVLAVSRNHVASVAPDETLTLLAIAFVPEDAPSGAVLLTFAGGAQIRLRVECIEAEMRDMGARWGVGTPPDHAQDDDRVRAPAPAAAPPRR